jgi:hypothetical protein
MEPATDAQKLYIYRLGKHKDDTNSAVVEGITKAFGLVNGIDTTLTESDQSKMDACDFLETDRNGQDPSAYLEALTENVLKQTKPEDFGTIRKALNEYRSFLGK